MKKIIIITSSLFLGLIVVWIAIMMVTYMIDSHKIDNDPTLYNGFKIIEEKQITAEDGLTFYTLQVDMNHPKTPYRLYVFPTKKKENHLFYVDSYMDKFKPSISYIIRSDNGGYYVIEDYIVNYNNGGFTTIAAGYLDSFEPTEENFLEYVPVVKKLVERGSWFWLYEGAEFLLKSEEKSYIMEVLTNFQSDNKEKIEYSEPHYRSTLTYEKMVNKCNELLQKYGGEQ